MGTCSLWAQDFETLRKIKSPHISGDTLYIEGRIGSHIYDYLAYETASIEKVKFIQLNSLGGDHDWALLIAEKLKSFKKTTVIQSQNFCASSCVYLFAAGEKRMMDKNTWLGIHGARLGQGYQVLFHQRCGDSINTISKNYILSRCEQFLAEWYDTAFEATQKAFDFMESSGISSELWSDYFSLTDDERWADHMNVLKKPDWVLEANLALSYNLATEVF